MTLSLKMALSIILFAILTRIAIPSVIGHPANFSPIDAIALFSGALLINRFSAIAITLLSVWLGDLFINSLAAGHLIWFYSGFYWQYVSYILIALLGSTLQNNIKPIPLAFACLGSASLFFIMSNFGVWYSGMLYPLTMPGLLECYIAAIPFFKHTLVSDLFFTAILFGSSLIIMPGTLAKASD